VVGRDRRLGGISNPAPDDDARDALTVRAARSHGSYCCWASEAKLFTLGSSVPFLAIAAVRVRLLCRAYRTNPARTFIRGVVVAAAHGDRLHDAVRTDAEATPDDAFGRYAKREYERRWLLSSLPPGLDPLRPCARITDHYIDGTRFRLRKRVELATGETVWKLTQKFPETSGATNRIVITNCYLNPAEHELFRRLPGRALVKCRWVLEHGRDRYAVDVFEDRLAGLVLAECEYPTSAALRAAGPPPFEAVEVTDQTAFQGGRLAGRAFGEIARLVSATRDR
jgi:CYTH domain-containing protein